MSCESQASDFEFGGFMQNMWAGENSPGLYCCSSLICGCSKSIKEARKHFPFYYFT